MLSDNSLIVTGLIVAVIGIAALFAILLTTELPLSDITVIDGARDGETVRVTGIVDSVRHSKNTSVTILTVRQEVKKTAVVFSEVNLTKGALVELEGTVDEYEGTAELVVTKVTVK